MKKLVYTLALLFVVGLSVSPAMANDSKAKNPTELSVADQAKLANIMNRVNEIKKMDKSDLTKVERKALRSELKEMKQQARALSGGVYLSVGAIIIVILLLILIL